jgi:hypothetical protein
LIHLVPVKLILSSANSNTTMQPFKTIYMYLFLDETALYECVSVNAFRVNMSHDSQQDTHNYTNFSMNFTHCPPKIFLVDY